MSVQAIIIAAVIVGGVGLFIGFFLGVSGEKFKVEVDEREEAIVGVLPGNNCGGCGYAGCSGLAAAISVSSVRLCYYIGSKSVRLNRRNCQTHTIHSDTVTDPCPFQDFPGFHCQDP